MDFCSPDDILFPPIQIHLFNLSASLAVAEKRVLLVDLDPQGNASSGVGISSMEKTSYEFMLGSAEVGACVQNTHISYLDILPSDRRLAGAEVELVNQDKRERFLKSVLDDLREKYEYIVIDTPPSLGLLTRFLTKKLLTHY